MPLSSRPCGWAFLPISRWRTSTISCARINRLPLENSSSPTVPRSDCCISSSRKWRRSGRTWRLIQPTTTCCSATSKKHRWANRRHPRPSHNQRNRKERVLLCDWLSYAHSRAGLSWYNWFIMHNPLFYIESWVKAFMLGKQTSAELIRKKVLRDVINNVLEA